MPKTGRGPAPVTCPAITIIRRFSLDAPIQVYYNPTDPSAAVLEPGFHLANILIFLLFGIFSLVVGGIFLVTSIRRVKTDLRILVCSP